MRLIHRDPAFWVPRGRVPSPHQLGRLEVDPQNPLAFGLLAFWLLGFDNDRGDPAGGAAGFRHDLGRSSFIGTDDNGGARTLTRGMSAVGPAAVFNGTSARFSSATADNAKFDHPNITFCAGITVTTLVQFGMIGCQWNESGNLRRWSLNINSTSGDLRADTSTNGTSVAATATTSTGEIAANRRHVVGIVANGTGNSDVGVGLQIFVDGTAKGSLASYAAAIFSCNQPFETGRSNQWGGAGRFLTGAVDFTAMWSRPLTAREMRQFQSDPFAILRPRAPAPLVAANSAVAAAAGGQLQTAVSMM